MKGTAPGSRTTLQGIHITVERTQRNIYPTYWDFHDKLMITPYVPNAASADTGDSSLATAELERLTPALADRPVFAYLKARCSTRQVSMPASAQPASPVPAAVFTACLLCLEPA